MKRVWIWSLSLLSTCTGADGSGALQQPPTGAPLATPDNALCRCFPGDSCWPSTAQLSAFNQSVNGRLIAAVPLGAPCHTSQFAHYDETRCKQLQAAWLDSKIHYTDPTSVMAPYFANQSCDPFQSRETQCVQGTYNYLTVNVSEPGHASKAIQFAKKHNIRFVIRNTGHDYNGKSTGAGSLAVWTHNLKSLEKKDWDDAHYKGPAVKMGAGVQVIDAYRWAKDLGYTVVGGECPTVGLAGGYTQGGGHSALASKYGLAADQALEWEVIDGNGEFRVARRDNENSDLYWALSGGGGGTYGVVLSLTSKLHQEVAVSGVNLTFTSQGISQDDYYDLISSYHEILPQLVDAGAMSIHFFNNETFAISPITAPGVAAGKLDAMLQPFKDQLKHKNVKYGYTVRQFNTYLDQFDEMMLPIAVGTQQYGGRFVSREVLRRKGPELTRVFREANNLGANLTIVSLNVNQSVAGNTDNAVVAGWRTAILDTVYTTPWSFSAPWYEMEDLQMQMTDTFLPPLEALTPGENAYMNEGDFRQPGWQQVFYGSNYDRLLSIKQKYDPEHVFWANKAVGSEYWEERMHDRRLCRRLQTGYQHGYLK